MAATSKTYKKLDTFISKVLKHRDALMGDAITERDEIVKLILGPAKDWVVKSPDLFETIIQFVIESVLPDSQGRALRGDSPAQHTFFDLFDAVTLHYRDAPLFKYRGKFTLFDLDKATQQRESNFDMVGLALRKWQWEVSIIRPLLVANPHWLYEDAYQYLLSHGGIPTPPKFDRDRPRRRGVAA